ncbi:MAG: universal stress protein [Saprospiraceae bacterium]|jgi:nucleotide-binding universal stress UspA family protein
MKKILVPTDFSVTAQCAMAYALDLSEKMEGATIDVVHMYLPATAAEYPNIVPPVAELLEAREKMLAEFGAAARKRHPGAGRVAAPVKTELIIGFPADEIVRLSADYDLVVLGATGEADLLDNMFGSVSSHVARKSKCPVILVPKGTTFQPIEQIFYASNFESVDLGMISEMLEINTLFGAKLHFVHVRTEPGDNGFEKSREFIFNALMEKGEPGFAFEIEEIEGEDVMAAINAYTAKTDIDLVVMVAKKRAFWDGLFHRSQTRRMALHAIKPLMLLHLE